MRCEYLNANPNAPVDAIRCELCPNLKGVMTKTNIGWVHMTCVNWHPEIWFDNKEKSEVGGCLNK